MKFAKYLSTIFSIVVLGLSVWVAINFQSINDWWFLRSYEPSDEIVALADRSDMSEEGRRLFYRTDPEINSSEQFNENCPFRERSFVLGCFSAERIYIFDVQDERLDGIEEVTAAHEMLHMVWGRMSDAEQNELIKLLEDQLGNITNQRVLDLVEQYRTQDPESINNEMHSIFGTEVRDLSPELEQHYDQYFNQRQNVVQLAIDYESVFLELSSQADDLLSEIDQLRIALDGNEARLNDLKTVIASLEAELETRKDAIEAARQSNDVSAEQIAVDLHNDVVRQLQSTIDQHNQVVADFNNGVESINSKVEQYNSIVVEQGELIDSIDSKKDAI